MKSPHGSMWVDGQEVTLIVMDIISLDAFYATVTG